MTAGGKPMMEWNFEIGSVFCPTIDCHSELGSVATGDSPRREYRLFRMGETLKQVQGDGPFEHCLFEKGNFHINVYSFMVIL